ncbi:glycosyltransferase family 1 protein [Flaviaesturariibacter flavus]|uniref:Glycosyltransferase family 1 protein n=1 Tax=Flaviaesturariibacter flavus TaxID=2502780 RepID=A0A4V2NWY8_9BACT|nr:glycosyltransferase family 1 protein [Flaviaesturariibacter flavus]TCJ19212.1 glycosyltransferase family 1 protein [Flaviaesturariibacter flavus]
MITNTPTAAWPHISNIDLICFSHLRWNFVYQRPQHLLSRFAQHTRVFFVEEPIFHDGANRLQISESANNVYIIVPHLQHGLSEQAVLQSQRELLNDLISVMEINQYFCWYYTPMALPFSDHLEPTVTVYDCMDELSAFKFAPPALKDNEQRLLKRADVVFTGGYSIYEAKQHTHAHIYPFPSSIDREHFARARSISADTADQAGIPHPRFGFYGVIDERFDIDMIAEAATQRPDWQFVLIGPVVKIDPATLPRNNNIHYLGGKDYKELPHYLAGWDVAVIPFAQNESTRYISPTKTPEYLAAGKPVISTPIRDVVSPYGDNKLVHIAGTAEEFIRCGDEILASADRESWLKQVDAFLAGNSWDRTWSEMTQHIENRIKARKTHSTPTASGTSYVSTESI